MKISFYQVLFPGFMILLLTCLLANCTQQGAGFALPKGDAEKGYATFAYLNCNECHSVSDIAWKGNTEGLHVPLGGGVNRAKTYGELVTSVINPNHKISKSHQQDLSNIDGSSKMSRYNEVMTVQELVDIVTFLQKEFKIELPKDYYHYYE